MEPVPQDEKIQLLQNQFFNSKDVVAITDEIKFQLKHLAIDNKQAFELYQENEAIKEKMIEEDKAKLQELTNERDRLLDDKRELEFEIIMLEDAGKTECTREQQRRDDVEHKIETLKLK